MGSTEEPNDCEQGYPPFTACAQEPTLWLQFTSEDHRASPHQVLWIYVLCWTMVSSSFKTLLLMAGLFMASGIAAQTELDERAQIDLKDGITLTRAPVFQFNLRFRMQNRLGYTSNNGEDLSVKSVDARVRRMRLRFDGYVVNDRLRYYIQLNFARADLDQDAQGVVQPVRDALVYYHFKKDLYIGFGQGKLPGNRQRVNSSGNLQFPDRSIANGAFTLDRDFGLFAYWTIPVGGQEFQMKGAISSGNGRNAAPDVGGMAYTGRLEWLPFGAFTNKGEYSEGDLEFEPRPKLSIGSAYSHNDRATRTGGQLGQDLYALTNINTLIVDMLLKYNGYALSAEFFDRRSPAPITTNAEGQVRFVTTGRGLNTQFSKVLRSNYEVAGRYSLVDPGSEVAGLTRRTEEALFGSTKYLKGHRVKLQAYAGYRWQDGIASFDHAGNAWTFLFQVEFGI